MADNESLNYLSEVQHMVITAGIKSLLEMTVTNSKTFCDRIDKSYDLVVHDGKLGVPRFYICGIEQGNHPVRVNLSAEGTVGIIKQDTIHISEDTTPETPIQAVFHADGKCYIGNTIISFKPEIVVIQWGINTPVTIKAMTIAFAIHCGLTKYPIQLNNIYHSQKGHFLSADVSSQAQSIECKPAFDTFEEASTVLVRTAGSDKSGKSFLYHVFNSSTPHHIFFMAHFVKHEGGWKLEIVDTDGNQQVVATRSQFGSHVHWNITNDSASIGDIFYFKQKGKQSRLQCPGKTIDESKCRPKNSFVLTYEDPAKTRLAEISNEVPPIVTLRLLQTLSPDERKLLLCQTLILSQFLYKINKNVPQIFAISSTTGSRALSEQCVKIKTSSIFRNFVSKLYVRAVGYSRIKNIVYFNVFASENGSVSFTVECTPKKDQQGVVKLVVRGQWNDVICTAVEFPGNTLAFYSRDKNLLGCQWKNEIRNGAKKKIMRIEKNCNKYESKHSPTAQFSICDSRNSLVAIIGKEANCTSIYRPQSRLKYSLLEVVFAIPLAVKINSAVYKMDEWPLPEITYRYRDVKQTGKPKD